MSSNPRPAPGGDADGESQPSLADVVDPGASPNDGGDAAQVGDRLLAARDRAAAALERQEAALDRHRAAEYLRRAYRDQLTGALQRAAGRDRLVQEIDRAQRAGEPLTVAFLDVVGLKQTNDQQGHPAGDLLLKAVGDALQEGLRSYDVIVRYGGDEFVCALPNTGRAEADRRFGDVSVLLANRYARARFSVGLAQVRPGDGVDDVIARADRDLYAARSNLRRWAPPDSVQSLNGNGARS